MADDLRRQVQLLYHEGSRVVIAFGLEACTTQIERGERWYLEPAMMSAFSISWYCSIWKVARTQRACGMSLSFVVLICFGYGCGIDSKLLLYRETGFWAVVVYLYPWNLTLKAFDAYLVMHFRAAHAAP